jgi:hypothetical protein
MIERIVKALVFAAGMIVALVVGLALFAGTVLLLSAAFTALGFSGLATFFLTILSLLFIVLFIVGLIELR